MRMRTRALSLAAALCCLGLPAAPATADEAMVELAANSGCMICHTIDKNPNVPIPLAPTYKAIAKRYQGEKFAFYYLLDRVKHGTWGREQVWSDQVNMRFMPPNVNVSDETARKLARWILTLPPEVSTGTRLVIHEKMLGLAVQRGCGICHSVDPDPEVPVPLAPSYREIAARYRDVNGAREVLFDAIVKGTLDKPQNWSDKVNMMFMPPNVNVSDTEARHLVSWILALEDVE